MLCERCKVRPATQTVVVVTENRRREWHLCNECAPLVAYGLVSLEPAEKKPAAPPPGASLRCSSCGLTYSRFLEVLRFGCADCYSAFRENLQVLLQELHGSSVYRGEPYRPDPEKERWIRELDRLQGMLETAVLEEDFERAAELRDRVKTVLEHLGWTESDSK